MQIGSRLAGHGNAVDRPGGDPVNKNYPLVAVAYFFQVSLYHQGFRAGCGKHFKKRVYVFVIRAQVKDANPTVAVQRFYDYLAVFGPEGLYHFQVAADYCRRHELGKMGRQQLFRGVADMHRIVDHQGFRVNPL